MNKNAKRMSKTKIYYLWLHMRQRCNYEKDSSYHLYGGRGIRVCDEWEKSFISFHKWAIENGYKEDLDENNRNKLSIERKDANGNYEPSNCKFANAREQSRNRRSNVRVKYNGKIITLIELSEQSGFPYKTLRDRWTKGERDVDRLIRPIDGIVRRKIGVDNFNSKINEQDVIAIREMSQIGLTQMEIAEVYSMHRSTISDIINRKTWKHV